MSGDSLKALGDPLFADAPLLPTLEHNLVRAMEAFARSGPSVLKVKSMAEVKREYSTFTFHVPRLVRFGGPSLVEAKDGSKLVAEIRFNGFGHAPLMRTYPDQPLHTAPKGTAESGTGDIQAWLLTIAVEFAANDKRFAEAHLQSDADYIQSIVERQAEIVNRYNRSMRQNVDRLLDRHWFAMTHRLPRRRRTKP